MPIVNTPERLVGAWSELGEADIQALLELGPQKHQIQNMRDRHHAVARLIVAGYRHTEVAEMLDMSETNIRILLDSPAFVGLLESYRERGAGLVDELRKKTVAAGEDALAVLHQRFLDSAAMQKVPLNKLSETVFGLLDRSGVGPSKSHTHTFGISADALASIKARVVEAEWSDEGPDSGAEFSNAEQLALSESASSVDDDSAAERPPVRSGGVPLDS